MNRARTQVRRRAEALGRRGEWWASVYLACKGWRVLGRRLKTPRGEVDMVVRRGRTIAFVEVKWRQAPDQRDLAIDARRLRRVAEAARVLAPRFARAGDSLRIDVLLLAPRRWPRHIVNASMLLD